MEDTGFNKFEEIQHTPLRVYNRVVMMNNILADFGKEKLQEYIEQFSEGERKQMFVMQHYLRYHGPKKTIEDVTKGVEFEDVSNQEEDNEAVA